MRSDTSAAMPAGCQRSSSAAVVNPTFGQLVSVGTATNGLPSLANIDPVRMFQLQARFTF